MKNFNQEKLFNYITLTKYNDDNNSNNLLNA